MNGVEQFLLFLQKSPFNMLLLGLAVSSGGMLLWPLVSRPFRRGYFFAITQMACTMPGK